MCHDITTKVTRLKDNLWGCRVFVDGEVILEVRVDNRIDIAFAFRDMMRTLDKLGFVNDRLVAARSRMNKEGYKSFQFIWHR